MELSPIISPRMFVLPFQFNEQLDKNHSQCFVSQVPWRVAYPCPMPLNFTDLFSLGLHLVHQPFQLPFQVLLQGNRRRTMDEFCQLLVFA